MKCSLRVLHSLPERLTRIADMKKQIATLVSLHVGTGEDMSKQPCDSVVAELDGFISDRHRGFSRVCWEGDTEPEGTVRRNNRQWSGVSEEELAEIREALDLDRALTAEDLGTNVCIRGIEGFSALPKGSKLVFPSGAVLVVEDYNPPCTDMGDKIAGLYAKRSGEPLTRKQFLTEARKKRGVVGSIDVPGEIFKGDEITVKIYAPPKLG